MPYSIMHPTDASSIIDPTPAGIAKALRSNHKWPTNRYKIIGPPTAASPAGAVDQCRGYAVKNADGSVELEPISTESG